MIDFKKFIKALFDNGFPSIPYVKSENCTIYGFFQADSNVYSNKHFYLIHLDEEIHFSEKQKYIYEIFNIPSDSRYDKLSRSLFIIITNLKQKNRKICYFHRTTHWDDLKFLDKNYQQLVYDSKQDRMWLVGADNKWYFILYDFNLLYLEKEPKFKRKFQYLKTSDVED